MKRPAALPPKPIRTRVSFTLLEMVFLRILLDEAIDRASSKIKAKKVSPGAFNPERKRSAKRRVRQ